MCIYIHVKRLHACIHTYIHTYTGFEYFQSTRKHTYTHTYVRTHTQASNTSKARANIHTHIYTYIQTLAGFEYFQSTREDGKPWLPASIRLTRDIAGSITVTPVSSEELAARDAKRQKDYATALATAVDGKSDKPDGGKEEKTKPEGGKRGKKDAKKDGGKQKEIVVLEPPGPESVIYDLIACISSVFGGEKEEWVSGEASDGRHLVTHVRVGPQEFAGVYVCMYVCVHVCVCVCVYIIGFWW
jgi:hypothetical protein